MELFVIIAVLVIIVVISSGNKDESTYSTSPAPTKRPKQRKVVNCPSGALPSLEGAINRGEVDAIPSKLYSDMKIIADVPGPDQPRITFALTKNGRIVASTTFIREIDMPSFEIGYSVLENKRGNKYGEEVLRKGFTEMKSMVTQSGTPFIAVIAKVDSWNEASIKTIERAIPGMDKKVRKKNANDDVIFYTAIIKQ